MTNPTPHGQVPASSAVLKAIREANMQLVRTGDDAFMLVPYKVATAQVAALRTEQPAPATQQAGAEPLHITHGPLMRHAAYLLRSRKPVMPEHESVAAELELAVDGHPTPSGDPSAEWLEVARIAERQTSPPAQAAESVPAPQPAAPAVEQVDLVGVRPNGDHVNLGKVAMPPRMKARELATEQFGHFTDDDGSDAELCLYALEQFLDWLIGQGWRRAQAAQPEGGAK